MKRQLVSDFKVDVVEGDRQLKNLIKILNSLGDGDAILGDGKIVDMYYLDKKYEVKSESYTMGPNKGQTRNVAYEQYSSVELKTRGGPWKALENGVDFFWSYFPKNNVIIEGKPIEIVNFLEERIKSKNAGIPFSKLNKGRNGGYTTTGYAVSIKELLNNNVVVVRKLPEV